jgi:hypothetical protein
MSDNKVTLDQLDNSAVEAMVGSIGDVNELNTENKTIVGALVEIVGKKEIANAIGEPLAETDKFSEMSSEINGLLSTFKTNMMNAGVVVENGDKFKNLIDKIKGLTEGEGNKGIQYAEGEVTKSYITRYNSGVINLNIDYDLDFVPTLIFAIVSYDCSNSDAGGSVSKTVIENFVVSNIMDHNVDRSGDTLIHGYTNYKITNITDKKCTLSITNTAVWQSATPLMFRSFL